MKVGIIVDLGTDNKATQELLTNLDLRNR